MTRARQLRFGADARGALMRGFDAVAAAVRVTLGPKGRYVVLNRRPDPTVGDYGGLTVTNDGVTVAGELELEGSFENQGARLARDVARQTNLVAGDGTTTAILLAQAILARGLTSIAAGSDPVALRRGLEAAVETVVADLLATQSTAVSQPAEASRVAGAAAGDERIAAIVAEAFERVGPGGVINVEPGKTAEIELEVTDGARVWNGYLSPHMITDHERGEAVLDDPYILIANQVLGQASQLLPVLERVGSTGRPLLVIADRVDGDALAALVVNKLRGSLACAAAKARYLGRHRREHLQELAMLTGGEVLSEELGNPVAGAQLSQLGRARQAVLTQKAMTIIDGAGDRGIVEARIGALVREAEHAQTDWDGDRIRERIGHLSGVIAVIKVGAATEAEVTELQLRVDDAVQATNAAFEEGIVPGGGVALLRAAEAIDASSLHGDEVTGAEILRDALEEPIRQVAGNSGLDGSVVVGDVRRLDLRHGLDASTGTYRDLIEAGVIDPTKVVRAALQSATSIAKTLIVTDCVVVEPRPRDPPERPEGMPDRRRIPTKRLQHGADARASLAGGVDAVGRAVAVTLGPRGRNVMIAPSSGDGDRAASSIAVSDDGAAVARDLTLADPFCDQGGQLVRQVAAATADEVGDGTTTATLLAQAIVRAGLRNVAAGADPLALRRGVEAAVERAVEELRARSIPEASRDRMARVAAIAAGDDEIGEVVARAFDEVGLDGVVTVEAGRARGLELEVVKGMAWSQGYVSRHMATDPELGEALLESPYVLPVDRRLTSAEELAPVLDRVAAEGRPLLLIAREVVDEALELLTVNKLRGSVLCVAVRPPEFLARRLRNLEDMAILTGGEAIADESGARLDEVGLDRLGGARRAVVTATETTIVDGAGDPAAVEERIVAIRDELERTTIELERRKLRERLARLASGVAVIAVGAPTEVEIAERRLRAEDAVRATEAALTGGIVPGGGAALLRARRAIDGVGLDGDEATGARIVRRALEEPLRRLAASTGLDGSVVVEAVDRLDPRQGLDAWSGEYCDLVDAGVIDPTAVVCAALENAASIAKTILVTECAVVEADRRP